MAQWMRTFSPSQGHRADGDEDRRRVRQRDRLRQRQVADGPEAAQHGADADQTTEQVAREVPGAQQVGPSAATAAGAASRPKKLRKKAISKVCRLAEARADGHRHQAEHRGAGQHQQRRPARASASGSPTGAHQPRFRFQGHAEASAPRR